MFGGRLVSRIILHSDANSFFASVEAAEDPSLKGKAVAVCGSVEERHGIVLAQSVEAKKIGIKTGMTVGEATKLLPSLTVVAPHYELYGKYSAELRRIYDDYTDRVEPFGLDECWLDISSAIKNFKDGVFVAETLKEQVKKELGITVSVGVSFNKIFAKLGSDMKKPDAVTLISDDNYKAKVFPLGVGALLGVGKSTLAALNKYGIKTIGELARCSPDFLRRSMGKSGETLWLYANGLENSAVLTEAERPPVKSVGNGMTPSKDLESADEVWRFILWLSLEVGRRLRQQNLLCRGVCLSVRDTALRVKQYQAPIEQPTSHSEDIAAAAFKLFITKAVELLPLRSLSVTAISLVSAAAPCQTDFFNDTARAEKRARLDKAVDKAWGKYGKNAVLPGSLIGSKHLRELKENSFR